LLAALENIFSHESTTSYLDHPLTLNAETMELVASKIHQYYPLPGKESVDDAVERALKQSQESQLAGGRGSVVDDGPEDKSHVMRTLEALKGYFKGINSLKVIEKDKFMSHGESSGGMRETLVPYYYWLTTLTLYHPSFYQCVT